MITVLPPTRDIAKRIGSNKYFTGQRCRHGHLAPRNAYNGYCSVCLKASKSADYLRDRDKIVAAGKLYREANKDRIAAQKQAWQDANRRHINERNAKWKLKNAILVAEKSREYREKTKDQSLAQGRKWRQENPEKANAGRRNYQSRKINRTPAWANHKEMIKYYKEAKRLYALTGIRFHVDHIVPLQGKNVCGLHVEYNLQILTKSENCRKSNKLIEALL